MTPQEIYDVAREWVADDNLNAYIVLTHHYNKDGKLEARGEIDAEYLDIFQMLLYMMRNDREFREAAANALLDLICNPEKINNNQTEEDNE